MPFEWKVNGKFKCKCFFFFLNHAQESKKVDKDLTL